MSPSGLAYSPSRRPSLRSGQAFSARPKWNPGHSFSCAFLGAVGTKLIFGFAERTLGCGVPITPRLSQKLQQTLGGQEGAEFVNWMHQVDARERDVATHGDLDQLRADIAELRQEMQVGFARLETRFERRVGDLIKWSFVFWVGAVGAIAMLARALR